MTTSVSAHQEGMLQSSTLGNLRSLQWVSAPTTKESGINVKVYQNQSTNTTLGSQLMYISLFQLNAVIYKLIIIC